MRVARCGGSGLVARARLAGCAADSSEVFSIPRVTGRRSRRGGGKRKSTSPPIMLSAPAPTAYPTPPARTADRRGNLGLMPRSVPSQSRADFDSRSLRRIEIAFRWMRAPVVPSCLLLGMLSACSAQGTASPGPGARDVPSVTDADEDRVTVADLGGSEDVPSPVDRFTPSDDVVTAKHDAALPRTDVVEPRADVVRVTCGRDGEACCATGSACGDGLVCDMGVCRVAPTCTALAEACTSLSQCCAGAGACRASPSSPSCCLERDAACTNDRQCCGSMRCTAGRCAAVAEGSDCTTDRDCDTDLRCTDGRCYLPCGTLEGFCSVLRPCCEGLMCTLGGACVPVPACSDAGAACVDPGQCCSGSCASRICRASACASDGLPCASTAGCCAGYTCRSGVCRSSTCGITGQSCASTSQCCVGYLCASGTCRPCADPGVRCSASSTCCSGSCVDGICR